MLELIERRMDRTLRKQKNALKTRPPERGADGVDLTLIRWMLSLTPAQRLRAVETSARSLMKLRGGRIQT